MKTDKYTVWVGGTEVNDSLLEYDNAMKLAESYRKEGHTDVIVECVEYNEGLNHYEVTLDCIGTLYYESEKPETQQEAIANARRIATDYPQRIVMSPSDAKVYSAEAQSYN